MKPSSVAVALGVAAAITSMPSQAADHPKASRSHRWFDSGMRVVTTHAKTGQPGHRWRYFADAGKGRAVVISPGGDYYYSEGTGLALVYKAPASA